MRPLQAFGKVDPRIKSGYPVRLGTPMIWYLVPDESINREYIPLLAEQGVKDE